ncbi:MAG TPA: histone deacetylase, partial [Burkholderiales bacterium]|nr:histone deacetylase [Burkholderiales bacterium]
YYSDHFVLPLPSGHRFPMAKYSMLRERVADAGLVPESALIAPPAARDEELLRAHDAAYLARVVRGALAPEELRRIGFPWSTQMVERSRRSAGATLAAALAALAEGCGVNLAGGTHHAFRDRGEGYCVFNDAAVAARAMQAEGRVQRVAIIDCDVHQGNGTASILAGDDSVFTFSIHGAKNFPFCKEASDLDIELPDGAGDALYLDALEGGLAATLARSRPQLAIYLAGADPWRDDRLGRLALSKQGLLARDRLVLETLGARGIPVAICMAGGYGRVIEDTVDIHFQTVETAAFLFQ